MPKEPRPSDLQRLRGKVRAFNISPKGHIEGVMVETAAGSAQLNFPKHSAEALAASMRIGAKIDLEAELETREGDHPVYVARDEDAEANGTIVALNYALHGEVNGYRLDDETFLHLKPEGAKKYKLRIGDKVRATGTRRRAEVVPFAAAPRPSARRCSLAGATMAPAGTGLVACDTGFLAGDRGQRAERTGHRRGRTRHLREMVKRPSEARGSPLCRPPRRPGYRRGTAVHLRDSSRERGENP